MEKDVREKRHPKTRTATLAALAVVVGVLVGAPSANADDPCLPENGCTPGQVEPPIDPGQAGDPIPVTVEWTPIPDVPSSVVVPTGLPDPSHRKACAKKRAHKASATKKKCARKRR
jgi:hypothetical protein